MKVILWILSSVAVFLIASIASGDVWQRAFDVTGQIAWRSDIVEVQWLQAGNPRTLRGKLALFFLIRLEELMQTYAGDLERALGNR